MSDLDRRSSDLDERLEVVAKGSVLKTRTAFVFFLLLAALLAAGFVAMYLSLRRITADTNEVVRDEVVVLERRNTELEDKVAVDEDLLEQATDAIVLLIETLQANGITPPEIVIRPTTTTVP